MDFSSKLRLPRVDQVGNRVKCVFISELISNFCSIAAVGETSENILQI